MKNTDMIYIYCGWINVPCGTKHAVEAFSDCLRRELYPYHHASASKKCFYHM